MLPVQSRWQSRWQKFWQSRWRNTLSQAASISLVSALLAPLVGCENRGSFTPVARIRATPEYIEEDDAYLTLIDVSAEASADPFDDPDNQKKLAIRWTLPADLRVVSGNETSTKLKLRAPGNRPIVLELSVTDSAGEVAHARTIVGLMRRTQ